MTLHEELINLIEHLAEILISLCESLGAMTHNEKFYFTDAHVRCKNIK